MHGDWPRAALTLTRDSAHLAVVLHLADTPHYTRSVYACTDDGLVRCMWTGQGWAEAALTLPRDSALLAVAHTYVHAYIHARGSSLCGWSSYQRALMRMTETQRHCQWHPFLHPTVPAHNPAKYGCPRHIALARDQNVAATRPTLGARPIGRTSLTPSITSVPETRPM
jgi:hypothetical protein